MLDRRQGGVGELEGGVPWEVAEEEPLYTVHVVR